MFAKGWRMSAVPGCGLLQRNLRDQAINSCPGGSQQDSGFTGGSKHDRNQLERPLQARESDHLRLAQRYPRQQPAVLHRQGQGVQAGHQGGLLQGHRLIQLGVGQTRETETETDTPCIGQQQYIRWHHYRYSHWNYCHHSSLLLLLFLLLLQGGL